DELLTELKAGRIDAAVLVRPSSGGSSRLVWHDLTRQPFVMLAPANAPGEKPAELLQRLGWVRYDPGLTGGGGAAPLPVPAARHDGLQVDRCHRGDGCGGARRDDRTPTAAAVAQRLPSA